MLRGMLLLGLLSALCHGQASPEVSDEDFGVDGPPAAADRDLVSITGTLGNIKPEVNCHGSDEEERDF